MAAAFAFVISSAVRALIPLVLIVAGWTAPALAITDHPISVAQFSAGTDELGGAKPRADTRPEERPCALSRKNGKRLRASKEQALPADDGQAASNDAIADSNARIEFYPRQERIAFIIDLPASPPRGHQFLSRAPPALTTG